MMQHNDHRAGSEKEERFEERMRKQVEHGCLTRCEPHGHDHVTKLRERGVSEDPFDVVLLRCD